MNKLMSRGLLWLASALLGLQGFVIFLDFSMETLFFDEAASFGINAALVWIVAKQRKMMKELLT